MIIAIDFGHAVLDSICGSHMYTLHYILQKHLKNPKNRGKQSKEKKTL